MGKKTAVVYFSKNGNTRLAANIICGRVQGKLIELKEKRKGSVLQALLKIGSKLQGAPWDEIKDAKKVFIMLPVWAGSAVPAANTFLKKADFAGKEVFVVIMQADPDLKSTPKVVKHVSNRIQKKNGTVIFSCGLAGEFMGKCKSEEDMKAQIDKTGILSAAK
ncbi:MAG: flavodoxin family protein [Christensenellales bacterium]